MTVPIADLFAEYHESLVRMLYRRTGDRDRAEGGDRDALDIDAIDRPDLEHGRCDEPADETADDPENDHQQQPLTRAHDLIGQEASDGADDDPSDETHLIAFLQSVALAVLRFALCAGETLPAWDRDPVGR